MYIKEAIQAMCCFDERHHIVVRYENDRRDLELEIIQIIFDGRNCVIEAEEN